MNQNSSFNNHIPSVFVNKTSTSKNLSCFFCCPREREVTRETTLLFPSIISMEEHDMNVRWMRTKIYVIIKVKQAKGWTWWNRVRPNREKLMLHFFRTKPFGLAILWLSKLLSDQCGRLASDLSTQEIIPSWFTTEQANFCWEGWSVLKVWVCLQKQSQKNLRSLRFTSLVWNEVVWLSQMRLQ